jgi:imidazolonepropionase-like amidohydrolase
MIDALLMQGGCPCCLARLVPARKAQRYQGGFIATAIPVSPAVPRVAAPPASWLRLQGGSIVDPRDGTVRSNVNVLMNQGRIVALESSGTTRTDSSVQVVDATGKFVVPGYNDMHSHALELENPSGALALMLADGVTGFRQMSGSPALLRERRTDTLPIGKEAPAVLELPGTILTPFNAGTSGAVSAEIAQQKQQGADFVKAGMISGTVFRAALEEARRIGIPILGHLQDGVDAAEASRLGFKSIEHLGPGSTVLIGCSTEEEQLKQELAWLPMMKAPPLKIPFLRSLILWRLQTILINPAAFVAPAYCARLQRALDTFNEEKCRALAAQFVANGTWHVPTLVRLRTQELADLPEYQNDPFLRYMPKGKVRKWRAVTQRFSKLSASMRQTFAGAYPRQQLLAKLLVDAGVRMMTGSDGGWLSAPGLSLQEEFVQLGQAGFTPLKVLQMTTTNAAEYLGRTATMGSVEPGRNADLVLLDVNPLERVENLAAIAGVVRAGVHHSRRELDGLKERVAAGGGYLR